MRRAAQQSCGDLFILAVVRVMRSGVSSSQNLMQEHYKVVV